MNEIICINILDGIEARMKMLKGLQTVKQEPLSIKQMLAIPASQCPYLSITAGLPKPNTDRIYKDMGKLTSVFSVDLFLFLRYGKDENGLKLLFQWGNTLWNAVHYPEPWARGCVSSTASFTDEGGINFPYAAFTLKLDITFVHTKGSI